MLPETLDMREFLASVEKAVIERALRASGGAGRSREEAWPVTK